MLNRHFLRHALVVVMAVALMAAGKPEFDDVRIIDVDSWTQVLADGDPIDQGVARAVTEVVSVAAGEMTYVAYVQSDGANNHVYLSRVSESRAEIWDQGTQDWTVTFADGDPIDATTTGQVASNVAMVTDSDNNVYISYLQDDNSGNDHVHLSRYNVATGQIEIWNGDSTSWSGTLTDADDNDDGIDLAVTGQVASGTPAMAVDNDDNVYIAYTQSDGANNHIYMSRYKKSSAAVEIWDEGTSNFSTTMANGDPIDSTTTARVASNPAIAVSMTQLDTLNDVYVTYLQLDQTGGTHVMLSRFDSSADDLEIWNDVGNAFSTTLTDADDDLDGIDLNTSNVDSTGTPSIVVNSIGDAFIAYTQEITNGSNNHIRLSMYDQSANDVLIWDEGGSTFTTTLTDGDPIDSTTTARTASNPTIVISSQIDSLDDLYIVYLQNDASANAHVMMSLYDLSAADITIWNDDAGAFSTTLTDADDDNDGIDVHTTARASTGAPSAAVDFDGHVWVAYTQSDGANNHIYLSKFDRGETDVFIWDEGDNQLTSTLTDGDPIDQTTTARASSSPVVTVALGIPTISFIESNGAQNHAYVSRFGQLVTASAAKSSDESTCLISRKSGITSWWWVMGMGALIVLGLARRGLSR